MAEEQELIYDQQFFDWCEIDKNAYIVDLTLEWLSDDYGPDNVYWECNNSFQCVYDAYISDTRYTKTDAHYNSCKFYFFEMLDEPAKSCYNRGEHQKKSQTLHQILQGSIRKN